jgi:hypothetical protein
MIVLATSVIVTAVVLAILFIAVVVGIRQEHPTDLSLQRPTCLASLAGRVVGLHVRRGVLVQQADPAADLPTVTGAPQ